MRKLMSALVLGVAVTLTGCASAQGGGSTAQRTASNRNSSLITQAQIDESPSSTAYDIVQRLHPQWLMGRGQSSFGNGATTTEVAVYVGSSRMGGPDELRNFIGSQLASIQFLNATQATLRFGAGHVNGAIILTQR